MTQSEWQKTQITLRKNLLGSNEELKLPQEEHSGAFLTLINPNGKILCEVRYLQENLVEMTETIQMLFEKVKEKNLPEEDIKSANINYCVIKDAIFLKNPLEWNMNEDGVCFQWGNKYRSYYMPYEIALIGGDKVRILDRLCCHKCEPTGVPSSLWRLPEGQIWALKQKWYK